MVRLPQNEKQTYRLNFKALKRDHQLWHWPWPWPWIFKVKYGISYISAKSDPIATKWKTNISIELQASNVTNGFDLDHNLDLCILKVKCDLDLWPHMWPWPWIVMVKFWNSSISEWEGRLTLHKGGDSRSFMTMTMTIWWPRSGLWIYQIVTRVTSVVGMPSTHLVVFVVGFDIQHSGSVFEYSAYSVSCEAFHIFRLVTWVPLVFSVEEEFNFWFASSFTFDLFLERFFDFIGDFSLAGLFVGCEGVFVQYDSFSLCSVFFGPAGWVRSL